MFSLKTENKSIISAFIVFMQICAVSPNQCNKVRKLIPDKKEESYRNLIFVGNDHLHRKS